MYFWRSIRAGLLLKRVAPVGVAFFARFGATVHNGGQIDKRVPEARAHSPSMRPLAVAHRQRKRAEVLQLEERIPCCFAMPELCRD
jgi:hypothetical protein